MGSGGLVAAGHDAVVTLNAPLALLQKHHCEQKVVFINLCKCAPGRIARGCTARPPLRSGPPPLKRRRPTRRGAGLSIRLVVRQGFDLLVSDLVARAAEELF